MDKDNGSTKLAKFFGVLPVIIMVTFANVIITSFIGMEVMITMCAHYNKYLSLGAALLIAVVVYAYIALLPKIRDYIRSGS